MLSLRIAALQPLDPAPAAAPATPLTPSAPAWASYVKPEAVEVMRNFFTKVDKIALSKDKALLNLAQGRPVEGLPVAPQLLPVFAAPLTPPAAATVDIWKNYNLMMVGFWYRFKFGFAVYKQLTKETGKWVDAAIKYFDMLANSCFSYFTFLNLFSALDNLKKISWSSDSKTYQARYLNSVKVREAYTMMWWLYNQNTLDLLTIEELLGVIPVDSKAKAWYTKWTPWSMAWAFMHWEVATDLSTVGLMWDGAAWDAAKSNKVAALWYRKKFALAVRSIVYALIGDGMPQQIMLTNLMPWLGLGLSWDAMAISFHSSLAAPPSTNLVKAEQKKQEVVAQELVLAEAHK